MPTFIDEVVFFIELSIIPKGMYDEVLFVKAAWRVKVDTTRTTRSIISSHYFTNKIKTNIPQVHKGLMKC